MPSPPLFTTVTPWSVSSVEVIPLRFPELPVTPSTRQLFIVVSVPLATESYTDPEHFITQPKVCEGEPWAIAAELFVELWRWHHVIDAAPVTMPPLRPLA